jgi:hypothetical protein
VGFLCNAVYAVNPDYYHGFYIYGIYAIKLLLQLLLNLSKKIIFGFHAHVRFYMDRKKKPLTILPLQDFCAHQHTVTLMTKRRLNLCFIIAQEY